jgi:hypothetical protein
MRPLDIEQGLDFVAVDTGTAAVREHSGDARAGQREVRGEQTHGRVEVVRILSQRETIATATVGAGGEQRFFVVKRIEVGGAEGVAKPIAIFGNRHEFECPADWATPIRPRAWQRSRMSGLRRSEVQRCRVTQVVEALDRTNHAGELYGNLRITDIAVNRAVGRRRDHGREHGFRLRHRGRQREAPG